MGWAVYESPSGHALRWAGYGVPAYCDHPDCNEKIDRGVSHICGGVNQFDGEDECCRLHFCAAHLNYKQRCERCRGKGRKHVKPAFQPKPDHPEWVRHVLTDPTWKEWLELHPEYWEKYPAVRQLLYVEHVYKYIDGLMNKPGAYAFLGEAAGYILEGLPQVFPEMQILTDEESEPS